MRQKSQKEAPQHLRPLLLVTRKPEALVVDNNKTSRRFFPYYHSFSPLDHRPELLPFKSPPQRLHIRPAKGTMTAIDTTTSTAATSFTTTSTYPSSVRPMSPGKVLVDAALLNDMIERLNKVQKEINQLNRRNFEKDRGKEFESSYTRIIFLMAITYGVLCTYMALVIESDRPFLDAIVPTVGFNISTWSLPFVKEWWIQARHYYLHGELESQSMRRLVVVQDDDGDAIATTFPTTTKKNNTNNTDSDNTAALDEVPTTDMECGSPHTGALEKV